MNGNSKCGNTFLIRCILQVSATLEKQVRAKEKELIAFQEKYKIRLKVSRTV